MTLPVLRKILRTMVEDSHVCIPFDVIKIRILSHDIVYYLKYEVLHLRIREVENHLCTSATMKDFMLQTCDDPVRMLLIKFTDGIDHFGLDPKAEGDAMLICIPDKPLYTIRELGLIHNPITETLPVVVSRVFVSEPTVIHDKEFTSHISDVTHHLVHYLLIDVYAYTFPAVKKDLAGFHTIGKLIFACPSVEIAAGSAMTFVRICHGKDRSLENFLWFKDICGIVRAYSGQEFMVVSSTCMDADLIVTAVTKSGSDHLTCVFLRLAIKGEHYFGMVCM